MSDIGIDGVTIHPLIAAQEKHHEPAVEFQGFLGAAGGHAIRLYTDLDTSSYVEIPKDAVLYWEKDPAVVGKISAYVAATREVTEVSQRRVVARSSALSLSGARLAVDDSRLDLAGPSRPMTGFSRCVVRCEGAFANTALRAAELEARALREQNDVRRAQLFSQAEDLKSTAKDALHGCLRRCPGRPRYRVVRNPDGSLTRRRFSLGELEGEICRRHLGEVSCSE